MAAIPPISTNSTLRSTRRFKISRSGSIAFPGEALQSLHEEPGVIMLFDSLCWGQLQVEVDEIDIDISRFIRRGKLRN